MLAIAIPGFGDLSLEHLVCDFNGTLAQDGQLLPGMADALATLAASVRIHVVTADTHGGAAAALASADVVTSSIGAALDLLLHPQRLIATLRE